MTTIPTVPPASTTEGDWKRRASQAINLLASRTTDVGTTAQRPAKPVNGQHRYNTTLTKPEWYDATAGRWRDATGTLV